MLCSKPAAGTWKFLGTHFFAKYFLSALGASPHSSLQEQLAEFSSLTSFCGSCSVFPHVWFSWNKPNISPQNGIFGGNLVLAPASNTCRSGLASPLVCSSDPSLLNIDA